MIVKPIKTKKDYALALKRLEKVFDASPSTPEGDEAELLAMVIDAYEQEKFPIDAPDPIEAIKIRMEEMGLRQIDLVGIIGEKGKVSEVLRRKRRLNLAMIRRINQRLQIPPSVLIQEYKLSA
jgi:HTH-type transcriptional regulator / antitoxin HigA